MPQFHDIFRVLRQGPQQKQPRIWMNWNIHAKPVRERKKSPQKLQSGSFQPKCNSKSGWARTSTTPNARQALDPVPKPKLYCFLSRILKPKKRLGRKSLTTVAAAAPQRRRSRAAAQVKESEPYLASLCGSAVRHTGTVAPSAPTAVAPSFVRVEQRGAGGADLPSVWFGGNSNGLRLISRSL